MYGIYLPTFTIYIEIIQLIGNVGKYIPYMDPVGYAIELQMWTWQFCCFALMADRIAVVISFHQP